MSPSSSAASCFTEGLRLGLVSQQDSMSRYHSGSHQAGISGRSLPIISPVTISWGLRCWKGVSSMSISHSTIPNDHTSAFSLIRSGSQTSSGAMKGSVPLQAEPCPVAYSEEGLPANAKADEGATWHCMNELDSQYTLQHSSAQQVSINGLGASSQKLAGASISRLTTATPSWCKKMAANLQMATARQEDDTAADGAHLRSRTPVTYTLHFCLDKPKSATFRSGSWESRLSGPSRSRLSLCVSAQQAHTDCIANDVSVLCARAMEIWRQ